jgi:outer membrane lipopolysaccharide assembly protein LptE/RlpB
MWGVVKTTAVLIGLLFLTQGCGAKWHLRRAVAKDPTILEQVAVKVDTIVVTEIKAVHDTLVLNQYDTIEIERNGVRIQLKRIHDTIQVTAECLPDTIQVTQVVKVPQVVYKEKEFKVIDIALILSIILATFALIKFLFRK